MPEISRFHGIVIRMFFADHSPPHFHAEYGGYEAVINIETLAVISGKLPLRAMGLDRRIQQTQWKAGPLAGKLIWRS